MPRTRHFSSWANRAAFRQPRQLDWELTQEPPGGEFRSPDGTAILDTIDLTRQRYRAIAANAPRRRRPESLCVHLVNPDMLRALSRTQRLRLLRCLSKRHVSVCLSVRTLVGDQAAYDLATPREGLTVDLATILILSVALRGDENMPLVGELIGLSKPSTIVLLAEHHWPPLRGSIMIAELATNWTEGQDRGIQLGLVLAGLRLCLRKAMKRSTLYWERLAVLMQAILGGLGGGFNPGAPAVLAIKPLMERLFGGVIKRGEKKFEEFWEKIWNGFRDEIETLIPRTSEQDRASFDEYTKALKAVMETRTPGL